jgi:hypothetical protein
MTTPSRTGAAVAAGLWSFGLFVFLNAAYWIVYIRWPDFHHRQVQGEDRIVEWITFAGFAGAAALAWSLLGRARRRDRWSFAYLALLGFFCFACAGEEISWGQRVFGFETPERVAARNEQNEFNLHNLELEFIHPKGIVTWMIKTFGVIAPLVLWRRYRAPGDPVRRYLPPLSLIPCFLYADLVGVTKQAVARGVAAWSTPPNAEFVIQHIRPLGEEMQEMYWGLSLLLALLAMARHWRAIPASPSPS